MARSRGGCANCKKLKRKCDESKPHCLACQRRGTQCGGYDVKLKWGNGVASRGRFTGAEVPLLKTSKPTVVDNARRPQTRSHLETDHWLTRSNDQNPTQSTSDPEDDPLSGALQHDQEVFSQFMEFGLNKLYATQTTDWIKPGLLVMAEESESVVAMCIAIQTFFDKSLSGNFYRCLDQALHTFQRELSDNCGDMKSGTMNAGLLLCTISILSGLRWTSHLHLMANLYKLHDDLSHLDPGMTLYQHHCLEVIGVMDQAIWIFGRENPCLGFWRRFRQVQKTWAGGIPDGIESVSGLPRNLLDILAEIDEPDVESRLWLWHGCIGEYVQAQLWDASRYAGMLFARRRRRQRQLQDLEQPSILHPHDLPNTEYLVWRTISALSALGHEQEKPTNQHMLALNGIVFPYVACCLEVSILRSHPQWKQTLDYVKDRFISLDTSENITALLGLLEDAWRLGDDDYDLDEATRAKGLEIAIF